MNTLEVQSNTIERVARTHRVVQADQNGNLPTRIEVLQVGLWDTPYHGIFEIHIADLNEMVSNFDAGIAMAGGSISDGGVGLPIDFGHDSHEEAAGWIKKLTVEGMSLYADVEWTASGKEALLGGNYKCFSPEFYPASRGGWPDPEHYDVYISNVLVGGGLTNIPLFKGLKPVMASTKTGEDKKNVIYISASEGEKHMPTLEEVLAKDVSVLDDADKQVLTDNKDTLTDEQKTKFGFEVTPVAPVVAPVAEEPVKTEGEAPVATPVEQEAAAIAASVKSGESIVIKASEHQMLVETAKEYRLEKATAFVKAHAERGAIKADQIDTWAKAVLASEDNKALLEALPDNVVVADQIGSSNKAGVAVSAEEEIKTKANEAIKASKDAGTELTLPQAILKVRSEDKELAERYDLEIKG